MQQFQIGPNEAGQRLDKYLKKLLKEAPDSFLYKMMRKKNIVLNGKKCDGKEKLSLGDEIKLFLADETISKFSGKTESPQTDSYEHAYHNLNKISIVYENDQILIANKPTGVLSQRASSNDDSVNEWLIGYLLSRETITPQSLNTFKPSICNRLDRNTSGMVICSKTLAGSQYMSQIIKDRILAKYYTCIVYGKVNTDSRIQGYLYKNTETNKVTVYSDLNEVPSSYRSEAAFIDTEIHPLYGNDKLTKLEIRLHTGKTHQIRAHLSSIGHPLIGDNKYGSCKLNRQYESLGVHRQLLHACRLTFPKIQENTFKELSGLTLICPEPPIFNKVLNTEKSDI